MESSLYTRRKFCALLIGMFAITRLSLAQRPSDAVCNKKLRDEISLDVTRAVGVFLNAHRETLATAAWAAARGQVTKEKIGRGEGIVTPVAIAVEASINTEFQNIATRIKPTIKVFLQTAIKRLCTLEDCCFQ